VQRGRVDGQATRNNRLAFGEFGLQVLHNGRITAHQIEAARTAITRHMRRRGKLWIKVFPDQPYTKKPLEVRMGKGKGNPEGWRAPVRAGNVIFEVSGCSESVARAAFSRAANKLPVPCKFLARQTA
jgi:large subunit ribosomal protein L16